MIAGTLKRLLRPTVWVTAERVFSEGFAFALFAVQARLLGPSAFGLVAAVMVFVNFWDSVPAAAAIEALVSVRRIEDGHYATAVIVMLLASLAFGAVVFAAAGPLAVLFGDAETAPVMRALAALPLLQAAAIVPIAATRRDLRFEATTLRAIVSLLAGGAVGLALALAGMGVWALVWQALTQRLVAAIVMWSVVPIPFKRGSLRQNVSARHAGELAVFVKPVLLAAVMSWASGQLPRLFLGVYLGAGDLGLYSTADRFNALVKNVAMVPKAFVARLDLRRFATDRPALKQATQQVFLQIGLLAFPICCGGAAVMPTLFHTFLDARWYPAILPAQMMLLGCIPYVTFYGTSAVLYAVNLQAAEARVGAALSVSIVAGMAVGAQFGLVATSLAVAAVPLLLMPLPVRAITRKAHLTAWDVLLPQARTLLAAATMGGAVALLRMLLAPHLSDLAALPFLIVAGGVLYPLLVAALMPHQAAQMVGRIRGRA